MNKVFFKLGLITKKDISNAVEYCKRHNKACLENKDEFCKTIVRIMGLKIPPRTNTCAIGGEIINIARLYKTGPEKLSLDEFYTITPEFLLALTVHGSRKLHEILRFNGFKIETPASNVAVRNLLSYEQADSLTDLDTLIRQ